MSWDSSVADQNKSGFKEEVRLKQFHRTCVVVFEGVLNGAAFLFLCLWKILGLIYFKESR